jgi:hypothetical protein
VQLVALSAGLGLQKPAIYLQAYLWKGVEANDKFLSCCSDVDVSTITQEEHLQFTSPVPDHKGKNIAAPDFRKERQRPWRENFSSRNIASTASRPRIS